MNVARRIKLSNIVEKIARNKLYADQIGIENKSRFRTNTIEKTGGTKR